MTDFAEQKIHAVFQTFHRQPPSPTRPLLNAQISIAAVPTSSEITKSCMLIAIELWEEPRTINRTSHNAVDGILQLNKGGFSCIRAKQNSTPINSWISLSCKRLGNRLIETHVVWQQNGWEIDSTYRIIWGLFPSVVMGKARSFILAVSLWANKNKQQHPDRNEL